MTPSLAKEVLLVRHGGLQPSEIPPLLIQLPFVGLLEIFVLLSFMSLGEKLYLIFEIISVLQEVFQGFLHLLPVFQHDALCNLP